MYSELRTVIDKIAYYFKTKSPLLLLSRMHPYIAMRPQGIIKVEALMHAPMSHAPILHSCNRSQGIIYVEAEKEAHVRDAIRGLRTMFSSKGVRLVPLQEMVDAITVNKKAKLALGACRVQVQVLGSAGFFVQGVNAAGVRDWTHYGQQIGQSWPWVHAGLRG